MAAWSRSLATSSDPTIIGWGDSSSLSGLYSRCRIILSLCHPERSGFEPQGRQLTKRIFRKKTKPKLSFIPSGMFFGILAGCLGGFLIVVSFLL